MTAPYPSSCTSWSGSTAQAEAGEAHLLCSATTAAQEAQEAQAHRSLEPANIHRNFSSLPASCLMLRSRQFRCFMQQHSNILSPELCQYCESALSCSPSEAMTRLHCMVGCYEFRRSGRCLNKETNAAWQHTCGNKRMHTDSAACYVHTSWYIHVALIMRIPVLTLMGSGGAEGPWGVTPGGAGGGGGGTQYVKLLGCVALVPIKRPT